MATEHSSRPHGATLSLDTSIPAGFAEQARRRPNRTAIAGTAWEPTYAELDAVSDELAATIAERYAGSPGRVATLLRHDAPLIAAMLAALKSGGTAVVLDARWPPERLRSIRERLEAGIVLVDASHRELALAAGFAGSELMQVADRPAPRSEAAPASVSPDDLAFLIHTSGTTGTPSAVMQTHRNIVHNAVVRLAGGLGIGEEDRVVLLASPSGGQGLSTVWTTLLTGGTICPFPAVERGVTGLPEFLAVQGVTVLVASASLFRHFLRTLGGRRLGGIRLVRLGSEQVFARDFEDFRRHFDEDCRFANSFSSSETGNVTQHVLTAGDAPPSGPLPVGRPAPGMGVTLLDDGEIAVHSDYLSPGYWRDEALTRQRFGDGVFRTGDLGRISEEGVLTVLGRKDSQVKIRGSRVDLVEVESALVEHPAVADSAVAARPGSGGELALTAYVASEPGAEADEAELRQRLRATLPRHAVPTAFAFVEAIPLNAHGKVDREALARIEQRPKPSANGSSAVTETEELLAGIWAGALEREAVGPDADFFELEGDSLTAAEIAAAVHDRFGVEIELDAFADAPTVAAMAELVELRRRGEDGEAGVRLPRVRRDVPIPCSLIQERTWRQSQTVDGSVAYNVASAMRLRGPLDAEAMRRCIDRLVARHESLRTTFAERHGEPMQVVHAPAPVTVPLIEVGSADEADELLRREAAVPFDLESGPTVRFLLLRLGSDEHRLLRLNHHINADGHSWNVFFRELAALYEADLRGEPPPLSEEGRAQYADFAAWERRDAGPRNLRWREDVEWWRQNLAGAPTRTALPFQRVEPEEGARVSDGVIFRSVPSSLTTRLAELQRNEGATYFMVRLAAIAALLAAMTGQPDVVVGTYGTTRRLVEARDMFGFFANPLALRLKLEGAPSFREWLSQVRRDVIEVSAHAQAPYDGLCEELREGGTIPPEFQAIFSVADDVPPARFGGLEMVQLPRVFGSMPWGFTLQARRTPDSETYTATFDARLHHPKAVQVFLRRYLGVLERACAQPDRPLTDLIPSRWRRFGPLLRRRVIDRR